MVFITRAITLTEAEHKPEIELKLYTPYLALTGELWGVHCEDWGENFPRYNSIVMYLSVE